MIRTYIVLIYFCLIASSINAQEAAVSITDGKFEEVYKNRAKPIIRGKINHASPEDLKNMVLEFTLVLPKDPIQTKFTTGIEQDGSFQLTLPSKLPYQQIWFSLGDYVYSCLYANEELTLIFDLNKLKQKKVYMLGEGMEFAGQDGEVNRTLNAYIMYHKKHSPDFHKSLDRIKSEDPRYLNKLDSIFTLKRKIDENFLNENNQLAKKIINSETEAYYSSLKLSYLIFQNDVKINLKEFQIPIYAITNESTEFLKYLHWYVNNKLLHTKEERINIGLKFAKIDSLFPSNYADLIKLQVSSNDLPEQLNINKKLLSTVKSKWLSHYITVENELLSEKINKINELLVGEVDSTKNRPIGKYLKTTSFHANLYLNEANSSDELLKSIKNAFPGKYIILDLWATWCLPCLENMPNNKALQINAERERLPVVFVYLCTDGNSSEELWQNKLGEIQQPGEHLFVQKQQMNELITLFNGGGYPTYAIIKPDGKINTEVMSLNRKLDVVNLKSFIEKQ